MSSSIERPSIEEIREILKVFLDSELQDLRLEIGDVRLIVTKAGAAGVALQPFSSLAPRPMVTSPTAADTPAIDAPARASGTLGATAAARETWVAVTSPSVGVFYRRPAPDQSPFVDVGTEVAANDPVCLIEVMKMFTSVVAPCQGRIVEILIQDATMVEYGQPLMYIEPS
jgi:acetyl-CoA carboxylase biotin carboxyl carrier protein